VLHFNHIAFQAHVLDVNVQSLRLLNFIYHPNGISIYNLDNSWLSVLLKLSKVALVRAAI
jgi:hypothetical protein